VKNALITGIMGQDGSYLAELLLSKGYEVHGLKRRASSSHPNRVDRLYQEHERGPRLFLHFADLTDAGSLAMVLSRVRPDEIYNLGAQSDVKVSFEAPHYTADVVAMGALRLLDAIRQIQLPCRFYQASSSEMYGSTPPPQNESSPFHPRSPYACAKVFAHNIVVNYRESYGLRASCGILFNHESPRRGETFVTRKITRAVAQIKLGLQEKLCLGNLEARRDWGFAGDYVQAMWLMLQQDVAEDFVIGTGEMHSVREFAELAFAHAEMDWRRHVAVDPRHNRPAEVDALRADCSKARRVLGWAPTMTFEQLVRMMVDSDLRDLRRKLDGSRGALSAETLG